MARRRKSDSEKKLAGTFDKRHSDEDSPARLNERFDPPRELSENAQRYWDEIQGILESREQLDKNVSHSLMLLCQTLDNADRLRDEIDKHGFVFECFDKNGNEKLQANPACKLLLDTVNKARALLLEFGLTDASRSKVTINPKEGSPLKDDPYKAYGLTAPRIAN